MTQNAKVAVAFAHGHTAKWLQVIMTSLKETTNNVSIDIYIATTWPNHPSIKAITETSLGENVTLVVPKRRLHSHAVGLDETIDLIRDRGYDYLFATETDCMALQNGWLDWYLSHVGDNFGMAGFFWSEGNNHHNINPSATLYAMPMLLKYHDEVRANGEGMFYHPEGNMPDTEKGMDPSIKYTVGVFSETRGFKNPTEEQLNYIYRGIPHAAWWEPGAWLFVRAKADGLKCVGVHCDHIYGNVAGHAVPEGTYYNGKADCKFVHFWGGTRAYDFLKHPVEDGFVRACAPDWFRRENKIWKNVVKEEHRKIVHQINLEVNMEEMMRKNLGTFAYEAM